MTKNAPPRNAVCNCNKSTCMALQSA